MTTSTDAKTAQEQNYVKFIAPSDTRWRVEIDEFLGDNELTNLFLLALAEMYKEDSTVSGKNENWWTNYSLSSKHSS